MGKKRTQRAWKPAQQKVDDIADMLHLMAHFSGITFDE